MNRALEGFTDLGWLLGNILPDSTAAPALQSHQKELERHMRKDSLEKQLQSRPKPEELVSQGILERKSHSLYRVPPTCHT